MNKVLRVYWQQCTLMPKRVPPKYKCVAAHIDYLADTDPASAIAYLYEKNGCVTEGAPATNALGPKSPMTYARSAVAVLIDLDARPEPLPAERACDQDLLTTAMLRAALSEKPSNKPTDPPF